MMQLYKVVRNSEAFNYRCDHLSVCHDQSTVVVCHESNISSKEAQLRIRTAFYLNMAVSSTCLFVYLITTRCQ